VFLDISVEPARNPWAIKPRQMINMSSDSEQFRTRSALVRTGWKARGNRFVKDRQIMVPLVEAKMVNLWNHRFATYHDADDDDIRKGHCRDATSKELENPGWEPIPRYWISNEFVEREWIRHGWSESWVVVFRRITNSTNRRTMIAAFAPRFAFGDKLPILLSSKRPEQLALLVANLNSIPFDYAVRNKAGGTQLDFFILYQLPALPPDYYDNWKLDGTPLAEALRSMALSLVCNSNALRPVAESAGHEPLITKWDDESRFMLMRLIDAIYARLYGLTRAEFDHILDSFPVLRDNEVAVFGKFRTKAEALRAFDALEHRLLMADPPLSSS